MTKTNIAITATLRGQAGSMPGCKARSSPLRSEAISKPLKFSFSIQAMSGLETVTLVLQPLKNSALVLGIQDGIQPSALS